MKNKNKNDELLDLVNDKDEVIGTIWATKIQEKPGSIHRQISVAVFNKSGEVLIQQRSLDKSSDPGVWKISVSGHVGSGEDPVIAAKRESLEELGIVVNPVFFKKFLDRREKTAKGSGFRFIYVYYDVLQKDPVLKLDENEVKDTRWIKPEDLLNFSKENNWSVNGLSHQWIGEIKRHLNKSK